MCNLGAENGDGVIGTKSYKIRGAPGNVVDDSIAACSYESSRHLTVAHTHGCPRQTDAAEREGRRGWGWRWGQLVEATPSGGEGRGGGV